MTQATQNSVDIINARVPGYKDLQMLLVNQEGIIEQILPMGTVKKDICASVIDVAGDWISLGGVDLQINGALGLAFPDLTAENAHILQKITQFLWDVGVDGFLPTLVTTSVEKIQRSLAVIANFTPLSVNGEGLGVRSSAKILGVHLEGPFLNYQKRGAHPAEYLLPLTIDEVKRVLGDYAHIVKVITLAPELDPTNEVIPYLRSLGITVSLGHSQATSAQAQLAFELGATMVTHAFNTMPPLHHREPGLLGAAITHPDVMCGFIADGEHVSPTMLQILLRASYQEKGLFLVSDALSPLGLPDGIYPWDSRQIGVQNGTARLADGTLSGTTLPLLVGVQNLVKWGICDVETAILLATDAPRQGIGLPGIAKSHSANLLRWHWDEATKELAWQRLLGKFRIQVKELR
ncbi:N-acetylglucosamine-6-phosphate deacetylase [Nostoc sp. 'Lobaria pulmonaria (5183) cyanobiont']|uniref:N-acetylglucosamine-6-phosphate deacetylase n=1 Tax=Nostoc sp. 'Lobaria pulmonaria (5183) cyanobiont' TaxID=1618022 RepID=UPI000CF31AB0|nr:N-acetylglucosamine-6-phosphate deacetylase [Nostoc sp. 'Lobaria pulmonaria (5183) cyanobiont']AVH69390.1 N-acetylglucosamine-6-phosphate deacetylase [Nostoc sp. 'Lobaria pulmonaria (5183) cyanobiont']